VSDELGGIPVTNLQQRHWLHIDHLPGCLKSVATVDTGGSVSIGAGMTPETAPDNDLVYLGQARTRIGRTDNLDLGEKRPHFDFGDSKARLVRFSLRATSRFAADFPTAKTTSSSSAGVESRWLKATTPPKKPEVAFVVPLFESIQDSANGGTRHRRRGGWFRVWLERPWFSSGEGELLALVCWPHYLFRPAGGSRGYLADQSRRFWGSLIKQTPPPLETPEGGLARLYTGWGLDPIWDQDKEQLFFIPPGAFANRLNSDVAGGVIPSQLYNPALPESGQPRVAVALYKPEYDPDERRWYADIRIQPRSNVYFPFVRLGLARYQPNAIVGCELSEIVTSEFVQLAPDRSATVSVRPDRNGVSRVRISVNGTRTAKIADPKYFTGAPGKFLVRIDESVGSGSQAAWVPRRDSKGFELAELIYDESSHSWLSERTYQLSGRSRYSAYLEERDPILVDKGPSATPTDVPVLGDRVVYADRIPL
jgi:hypothetical protein